MPLSLALSAAIGFGDVTTSTEVCPGDVPKIRSNQVPNQSRRLEGKPNRKKMRVIVLSLMSQVPNFHYSIIVVKITNT